MSRFDFIDVTTMHDSERQILVVDARGVISLSASAADLSDLALSGSY